MTKGTERTKDEIARNKLRQEKVEKDYRLLGEQ